MTECICVYRNGPTKIANMLHLWLSYLRFWSGTHTDMTENGITILGVKRRTETLFNPLYIYKKHTVNRWGKCGG